jgi:hypothetical protein
MGLRMKPFAWLASLFVLSAANAQAPDQPSAWTAVTCDHACLSQFARDYMAALARRNASMLRVHAQLRFTENNVEMPFGITGLWATATGVAPQGLIAADTQTGQVAWIGTAEENGRPVYFGLRLGIRDNAIAEAEQIVVRNTGLPLPFGDVTKVVHDPTFNEILPPEQRRSRERLRAVADSYFNTVELNDGTVFAPFDDDCGRLENGILTTAAAPGSAGAIAAGCEAQFRLGIYRINKRIRERRYPLIDVERGVVVATGFFDHANEFDRYKTTDGIERRTALKWPNSISLVEAFRIRNGRIHRIEAVFTYVPYFMHSPFYAYPPATTVAWPVKIKSARSPLLHTCDKPCLLELMDRFMDAMVAAKPQDLPWAPRVRFTENSVGQQIGEGIWGSIRSKSAGALRVADAAAGNVVWYGLIHDHDAPAWAGIRLGVRDAHIAEVEVIVARERNPGPFGDPKTFVVDPLLELAVAAAGRTTRRQLLAAVEGYARTMQGNDGTLHAQFKQDCKRTENGVEVTQGDVGSAGIVKAPGRLAQGCEAQLTLGMYRPLDQLRGRRVLAVDEARGLVVVASLADFGLAQRRYRLKNGKEVESQDYHPFARELFEVFRIEAGRIRKIEAVSVAQPLGMPSAWSP